MANYNQKIYEEVKIPNSPSNNKFDHVIDEIEHNEENLDITINESKDELNPPKYEPKLEYLQRENNN